MGASAVCSGACLLNGKGSIRRDRFDPAAARSNSCPGTGVPRRQLAVQLDRDLPAVCRD